MQVQRFQGTPTYVCKEECRATDMGMVTPTGRRWWRQGALSSYGHVLAGLGARSVALGWFLSSSLPLELTVAPTRRKLSMSGSMRRDRCGTCRIWLWSMTTSMWSLWPRNLSHSSGWASSETSCPCYPRRCGMVSSDINMCHGMASRHGDTMARHPSQSRQPSNFEVVVWISRARFRFGWLSTAPSAVFVVSRLTMGWNGRGHISTSSWTASQWSWRWLRVGRHLTYPLVPLWPGMEYCWLRQLVEVPFPWWQLNYWSIASCLGWKLLFHPSFVRLGSKKLVSCWRRYLFAGVQTFIGWSRQLGWKLLSLSCTVGRGNDDVRVGFSLLKALLPKKSI